MREDDLELEVVWSGGPLLPESLSVYNPNIMWGSAGQFFNGTDHYLTRINGRSGARSRMERWASSSPKGDKTQHHVDTTEEALQPQENRRWETE